MLTQLNTTLFSEYKSNQIVELDDFKIKFQVLSLNKIPLYIKVKIGVILRLKKNFYENE